MGRRGPRWRWSIVARAALAALGVVAAAPARAADGTGTVRVEVRSDSDAFHRTPGLVTLLVPHAHGPSRVVRTLASPVTFERVPAGVPLAIRVTCHALGWPDQDVVRPVRVEPGATVRVEAWLPQRHRWIRLVREGSGESLSIDLVQGDLRLPPRAPSDSAPPSDERGGTPFEGRWLWWGSTPALPDRGWVGWRGNGAEPLAGWAPLLADLTEVRIPLRRPRRLEGRVVDEAGLLLEGVWVGDPRRQTGEDGAFTLTERGAAPWSAELTSPERVSVAYDLPDDVGPARDLLLPTRTFAVVRVVDLESELPLAAARVSAVVRRRAPVASDAPLPGAAVDVPLDERGTARLPVAPGDAIDLVVEAPGYGRGTATEGRRGTGAVGSVSGDLGPAFAKGTSRPFALRLRRGRVVKGVVELEGGRAEGLAVGVAVPDEGEAGASFAHVQPSGVFELEALGRASRLSVDAPGFDGGAVTLPRATSRPHDVGTLRLRPRAVIVGRVKSGTWSPRQLDVTVDGTTDAVRSFDGASFALVSPVVSGHVRAKITSLEWEPVAFEVDVPVTGGVVDAGEVRLDRRKTLRLRLVSPAGAAVAGLAVAEYAEFEYLDEGPFQRSDAQGEVVLPFPESLSGNLFVRRARPWLLEIRLDARDPDPLVFTVPDQRELEVKVRATDGGDLDNTATLDLTAIRAPWRLGPRVRSCVGELRTAPAAAFVMGVSAPGHRPARVEVPAGVTTMTVTLERVTDADRARAAALEDELRRASPVEWIEDRAAREAEAARRERLAAEVRRLRGD